MMNPRGYIPEVQLEPQRLLLIHMMKEETVLLWYIDRTVRVREERLDHCCMLRNQAALEGGEIYFF